MTTSYTPAELAAQLGLSVEGVLLWLAAAVGAVVVVMFTLVGLRKALEWAVDMIRGDDGWGRKSNEEVWAAVGTNRDEYYGDMGRRITSEWSDEDWRLDADRFWQWHGRESGYSGKELNDFVKDNFMRDYDSRFGRG